MKCIQHKVLPRFLWQQNTSHVHCSYQEISGFWMTAVAWYEDINITLQFHMPQLYMQITYFSVVRLLLSTHVKGAAELFRMPPPPPSPALLIQQLTTVTVVLVVCTVSFPSEAGRAANYCCRKKAVRKISRWPAQWYFNFQNPDRPDAFYSRRRNMIEDLDRAIERALSHQIISFPNSMAVVVMRCPSWSPCPHMSGAPWSSERT